jgi:hypothetical protein
MGTNESIFHTKMTTRSYVSKISLFGSKISSPEIFLQPAERRVAFGRYHEEKLAPDKR